MLIDVSDEQPSKQLSSKRVTDDGIIVFLDPAIMVLLLVLMIAWQFSRESNTGLFASTRIEASDEHSLKHPLPILVTEEGMVIEVSDEQP